MLCLQSRFINYFGGPCIEFGQLLYEKLFGEGMAGKDEEEEEASFVAALSKLRKLSSR